MRTTPILFTIACLLLACGSTTSDSTDGAPPPEGEVIFNTNCTMCHGRKGDLGMSGAKDLTKSVLKREDVIAIITNGKGGMMPYGSILTKKQIEAVAGHVIKLRTPGTPQ